MAAQAMALPKTFNPQELEEPIYEWWERQGFFTPKVDPTKRPFVISMPPPNVTGELHMGHAMFVTLEDLMIRYHRMKGDPTLWVPGTDHAGIATQVMVEREIAKEGLTRHQLGRERFLERVWAWKEKYGGTITRQLRRLGASCDWTRERFTMDPVYSRAVREAFVRLYERGLIYRGEYLINWCPRCETALSDLEVEREEEEEGLLYYVRYPLLGDGWEGPTGPWGSGRWAEGARAFITVATTRPETILGDTAVAVHPEDERYTGLVGRIAVLPALGRRIPIIADPAVDRDFGTGAVKVTPGHDPTDYEIGERHGLPRINVMNRDATINENGGPYAGMDRFRAREALVEDLRKEGLLVKIEPHRYAPGRCQRCDTIVEPLLSLQWFVNTKPLAEEAIRVVKEERIRILPERFEKDYFRWLENIRPWCISRQLWWGHRIPAWYCDDCGHITVAREDPTACARCGGARIRQDEDVLDTWFSSALWPFATLGWPDETEDLRYFYPTTVMETGYDILFFWVARMVMMGLAMTGEIPFQIVYLHGLVRDEKGEKMSKTKGNVIDPLVVIREYGADALRFTLATGSTPGNDMRLSLQRVEGSRNFANKLWNAARFVLSVLPGSIQRPSMEDSSLTMPDRWILSRYHRTVAAVTAAMEAFDFGEAGRHIYEFAWDEFCDWYIEIAKEPLYRGSEADQARTRGVLVYVLDGILRMLHPFMPFITEALWGYLKRAGAVDGAEALIVASWPSPGPVDESAEAGMQALIETIRAIRNAREAHRVPSERRIAAWIAAGELLPILAAHRDLLTALARVDPDRLMLMADLHEPPEDAVTYSAGPIRIYLPLAGLIDRAAERARLERELADLEARIARTEALLASEFAVRAPAAVVEKERRKLEELKARRAQLQAEWERLKE